MAYLTNLEIAQLLRDMAAAYEILGENRFKIIAYDKAADSIEHLTSEVKDYYDDGKLAEIPGVGTSIASYLDELFRTGKIKHFDAVMSKVPKSVFPLLLVPGIGPKKAYKLVSELKIKDKEADPVGEVEFLAKAGKIAPIAGFGKKSEEVILEAIASYKKGQIKENRMTLPIADSIAREIISHLQKVKSAEKVDVLGSLRRQVSTIGDIDIAVATKKPNEIIELFLKYPHQKIIEKGPTGGSILLHNGRQVDLRVQKPELYGAMLQYFTGSKNHNIKLRDYALKNGKSLNEYGIKSVKTGKVTPFATEEVFYKSLGMSWILPELREDKGEIEAAIKYDLPKVVELKDIKGDLHIHTNYDLEPSHDLGADPLADYLVKASSLGYEYIGLSDHNPSITNHSEKQIIDIMKRRKDKYEQLYDSYTKSTHDKKMQIFIMCEVDILPDGKLALPEKAFDYVDAVIVSVHSSFTQAKQAMTKRIISGLTSHSKVKIFGHPTARILTRREGIDLNWPEIFEACKKHHLALEINAYPDRLDLPDSLVFDAVRSQIPLVINTDSHAAYQMDMMKYGVSVARRGWATEHDIINTLGYNEFKSFLMRGA